MPTAAINPFTAVHGVVLPNTVRCVKAVRTLLAEEFVRFQASLDTVVAGTAPQYIVAAASCHTIVTTWAADNIASRRALKLVGSLVPEMVQRYSQ